MYTRSNLHACRGLVAEPANTPPHQYNSTCRCTIVATVQASLWRTLRSQQHYVLEQVLDTLSLIPLRPSSQAGDLILGLHSRFPRVDQQVGSLHDRCSSPAPYLALLVGLQRPFPSTADISALVCPRVAVEVTRVRASSPSRTESPKHRHVCT